MNGIPESQMLEFAHDATVPIGIENGTIKVIPLSQGLVTIVDAEDYASLNKRKWYALKIRGSFYGVRKTRDAKNREITLYMHREILGLSLGDGLLGDHKNRYTLNNRRGNLRIATRSLNQYNKKLMSNNTSGFRGVSWAKRERKWESYVGINGKMVHCGYHTDLISAAKAYDKAAIDHWGDEAILNLPERSESHDKL
jgi:hypothetical protein